MSSRCWDAKQQELTWPSRLNGFPTFWDYIFSRENKPFKRLFFRVHWLSEGMMISNVGRMSDVTPPRMFSHRKVRLEILIRKRLACLPNIRLLAGEHLHPGNLTLIPKIAMLKGSYLFQGPSFWGPPFVSFRECKLWGAGGGCLKKGPRPWPTCDFSVQVVSQVPSLLPCAPHQPTLPLTTEKV